MQVSSDLRLQIRPIPKPLHGLNLRLKLGKYRWRKLRASLLEGRPLVCEICGSSVAGAKDLNGHEEWTYNTKQPTAVARLDRIIFVCWFCHSVEHFMHTFILAQDGELSWDAVEQTIEHFCRVNKTDKESFDRHREYAMKEWADLSGRRWSIDYGEFSNLIPNTERDGAPPHDSAERKLTKENSQDRLNAFVQELVDISSKHGIWIGRLAKTRDTPLHFSSSNDSENSYVLSITTPLDAWADPEASTHTKIGLRWTNDPIDRALPRKTAKGVKLSRKASSKSGKGR